MLNNETVTDSHSVTSFPPKKLTHTVESTIRRLNEDRVTRDGNTRIKLLEWCKWYLRRRQRELKETSKTRLRHVLEHSRNSRRCSRTFAKFGSRMFSNLWVIFNFRHRPTCCAYQLVTIQTFSEYLTMLHLVCMNWGVSFGDKSAAHILSTSTPNSISQSVQHCTSRILGRCMRKAPVFRYNSRELTMVPPCLIGSICLWGWNSLMLEQHQKCLSRYHLHEVRGVYTNDIELSHLVSSFFLQFDSTFITTSPPSVHLVHLLTHTSSTVRPQSAIATSSHCLSMVPCPESVQHCEIGMMDRGCAMRG